MFRVLASAAVISTVCIGAALAQTNSTMGSSATTSTNSTMGTTPAPMTSPAPMTNSAPMTNTSPTSAARSAMSPNSTMSPANNSSANPASVTTSNAPSKTSAAPVAGANSFTRTEAMKRIQSFGYTKVVNLKKDNQSIWRGQAMKDGKQVNVALDYQGNVVGQ